MIGPKNTRIVTHFEKIDLEEQSNCLYDYVSIEDDSILDDAKRKLKMTTSFLEQTEKSSIFDNNHSPRLYANQRKWENDLIRREFDFNKTEYPSFLPYLRFCGTYGTKMSRFDFVSKMNRVKIHFHSDYSVSGSGFSLKWKAVSMDACPSKIYTASEQFYSITSPDYPNILLNDLNCTYIITAEFRKRIWLEFRSLDLIDDANIEIDLGNGMFKPFVNGGQLNDGVFVSYQNRVIIHFTTGAMPRGNGFNIFFKTSE